MARPPLVDAHIEGQARLRLLLEQSITSTWNGLPGHDRDNVDEWLSKVLPAVETSQRASVALTEAFLAQSLERKPLGIPQDELIGAAVRNGTAPATVYERPFITLWGGLGSGLDYQAAAKKALDRATSTAAMDVQLSMRATADAVQENAGGIYGYKRAADATACDFCKEVDGAYVKRASAFPLHNRCGCGLEALTEPHPLAVKLPSGVAVHEHGEMGALLTAAGDHFTTAAQI